MAIAVLGSQFASAQSQKRSSSSRESDAQEWYQKMKQAKIAFFSTECKFTEDEAKAFWPVYDQIEEERRDAAKASMDAYRELMEAVKAGKSEGEIDKLLKKYSDASAANVSNEETIAKYKKVLPASKVAKVILAEEKFRQQQIHRLHGDNGSQGGFSGGRPGGNDRGSFGGGRPGGSDRGGFGGGRPGGDREF